MGSRSGEQKFSYADFCIEDADGRLETLVSELEAYVTGMVQVHMDAWFADAVRNLNLLGHQLELNGYDVAGMSYEDGSRGDTEKRRRLALNFTVSAGFEVPSDRCPD